MFFYKKIAVLSDIHGNYRALETTLDNVDRWKPDLVLIAGDISNRGPRSLDCLKLLEERKQDYDWKVIRGNHEDYIISLDDPIFPRSGSRFELNKPAYYCYLQLKNDLQALKSLPEMFSINSHISGEVRMVHASMLNNRDGIYPEASDDEIKKRILPLPNVFITGHTHRPFIRSMDGTLIVNAGSVGLPFDRDPRAGYTQLSWYADRWHAKIIRLKYDTTLAEKDFSDYGYLDEGGPITHIILLELKTSLSHLYPWLKRYKKPILEGKITVAKSTQEYLLDPIVRPYW